MKRLACIFMLFSMTACGQIKRTVAPTLHESSFHKKHEKIIKDHLDMLVRAGRITDPEHVMASTLLGTYGWYSGICDEYVEKDGTGGGPCSFGAYTFSQAAFEQAKRLYVIHGEMLAGSDILTDASWGECIPEKGGGCVIGSSDGYTSPRAKGAFDAGIVGYMVPSLTYCMKYGAHYEHCDSNENFTDRAKIIKFIDGGHVQLDHKAKYDAQMYGLMIAPLDYVDMCNCSMPMGREDKPAQPCVQGGTLQSGESCSVSISQ